MTAKKYPHSLTASARASAVRAIDRFQKAKHQPVQKIGVFADWLRTGPKERGRPAGSRKYDDEVHLVETGRLLETGEARNRYHAVTIVVQGGRVGGASDEAKIKRLYEAVKKDEGRYRRLGREKIAKDETPGNL